jgi:putative molybdopterin biosynthesis protein
MSEQQQFLDVIDRDEAERRFQAVLDLTPRGEELVSLDESLGRVLAHDIASPTNVPSFDRSNYDGFALRAGDTTGADEQTPHTFSLFPERLDPGVVPQTEVTTGTAVAIATGGMVPRGANAVAMVEYCDLQQHDTLLVRKAVFPGFGIAYTATDISAGETVLRAGELLSSRATGILAAIGVRQVTVCRQPRVAIISTGNEIIAPGDSMRPGLVYDSNARILADAVSELGGVPICLGIVRDDLARLREQLQRGLAEADIVLLSGGTSKGQGDLSYHVVGELEDPGIVAHGVALKPGKPICLAATAGKPVVILPGFPTSAIFTFHEFVAPVIQAIGGRPRDPATTVEARLAIKVNSEVGRTEYLLVGLVHAGGDSTRRETTGGPATSPGETNPARLPDDAHGETTELVAYPMGKGSGSVTTFSQADGFVTVGRHQEIVQRGTRVQVQLLGHDVRPADLVVIGSHCVGFDYLLGELSRSGWRTKFMVVGSSAGLEAARRGECDLAGVHLLDPATGLYNEPFLTPEVELVRGYGRRQGILYRKGDLRFEGRTAEQALAVVRTDPSCTMVNRNQGSGTRILVDRLLAEAPQEEAPAGYALQVKNHHAVAAAIRQQRADWGVAIETVARQFTTADAATPVELGFLLVEDERFDFIVPKSRVERPAVQAFRHLLSQDDVQRELCGLGYRIP